MDIKPRHSDRGSILKKIRRRFLYRPSPESRPDQAAQNNRNRMPGYILIGILAAISLTDVWLCYAYIDILSGLYLRNVASESICGIVCLLIEISIVRGGKNSRSSIYFSLVVAVCGLYLHSDLLFWCVDGNPRLWSVNYISNLLYAACPLYLYLFFWLFVKTDRLKKQTALIGRLTRLVIFATAGLTAFLILNYPAGYFYKVSRETGLYSRGNLYLIPTVIMSAVILICLAGVIRQKLFEEARILLLSYPLVPLISVLIDLWTPTGPGLDVLVTFCAVIFMYTNIYVRNEQMLLVRENALIQSQMNALQQQINPHFLFNTLGTIDSLCEDDPALAQKVIRELSQYMSRNLRTFSDRQLIPFREEMEQVTLYLKIMQVRFPNIRLESELGSEEFYLPPLSVQLLVENAVLHGICKRRRSEGTVRITSAKLAHGYRVTVEDNGVGFSGELPADGEKHIGIANVSRRLETLCGGSLAIRSLPGEGTLCIIRVPESCGTDWRGERRADRFNAEV